MTNLTPDPGALSGAENFPTGLLTIAADVQRAVVMLTDWLETAWQTAERKHQRAARLQAYRVLPQWKKSDWPRLQAIGISDTAARRFKRAERANTRGRPIVARYQPLDSALASFVEQLRLIFGETTSPRERRRALIRSSWWPYFVESVYRGQLQQAKSEGKPGPSAHAEESASNALGISPALMRKTAAKVRKNRRDDAERNPDFPALRASEFATWQQTGHFPNSFLE